MSDSSDITSIQIRRNAHHSTAWTVARLAELERVFWIDDGACRLFLGLADQELCRDVAPANLEHLATLVERKRLVTFSPGMAFGEIALVDRSTRTADVVAEGDVECLSLSIDVFESLAGSHPGLRTALLANLVRLRSRRLRAANEEIEARSS